VEEIARDDLVADAPGENEHDGPSVVAVRVLNILADCVGVSAPNGERGRRLPDRGRDDGRG
jgi:hypothetical protein